jgi:hypothetical protein
MSVFKDIVFKTQNSIISDTSKNRKLLGEYYKTHRTPLLLRKYQQHAKLKFSKKEGALRSGAGKVFTNKFNLEMYKRMYSKIKQEKKLSKKFVSDENVEYVAGGDITRISNVSDMNKLFMPEKNTLYEKDTKFRNSKYTKKYKATQNSW